MKNSRSRNDQLAVVIAVVRRGLITASSLLDEIGTVWWRTPTLHPTGERGESFHGRKTLYFLWIRDLFDRLSKVDPEAATRERSQWPINDTYFFGKLSIYAAMAREIVSTNKVAALIADLNDKIFWDPALPAGASFYPPGAMGRFHR